MKTFAEYIATCSMWGPVGFWKEARNGKSILQVAPGISHSQFLEVCFAMHSFLETGVVKWPTQEIYDKHIQACKLYWSLK